MKAYIIMALAAVAIVAAVNYPKPNCLPDHAKDKKNATQSNRAAFSRGSVALNGVEWNIIYSY